MGALFRNSIKALSLALAVTAASVAPGAEEQPAQAPSTTAPATTPPPKITDQLPQSTEPSTTPSQPAPETPTEAAPPADQEGAGTETDNTDETSLGEIPEIKAVELTDQTAKSAIDTYMLLKDKYKDAKLEDYETLQEFVEKDPQGRAFEADVKAAGFADVEAWNQAITTVSTTYSNLINDQSDELRKQIAEIEQDNELAQDMKDRLLNSLKALIPSENNKKVVAALQSDPAYKDKLQQLETEEE